MLSSYSAKFQRNSAGIKGLTVETLYQTDEFTQYFVFGHFTEF
jgi:hypothetical protein